MSRTDFYLVAQIPTYREGRLALGAIGSCLDSGLDGIVVWEGPAGPTRLDDAPETVGLDLPSARLRVKTGEWANDADKRTAMLRWTKEQWHDRPLWVVLVDGDEVLVNGRYLRDHIQAGVWQDELHGRSLADPDNLPTGGLPLRIVEADGSVSFTRSRVFNAQMIRRFVVSNLIVETAVGSELRLGHRPEPAMPPYDALLHVLEQSPLTATREEAEILRAQLQRHFVWPPLPCEPHLFHRTHLRHPSRQGLRLHEQERDEIVRLGYPTGDDTVST